MPTAIRLRDLAALSRDDREGAIGGIADDALGPVNGFALVIKAKIQAYESRYEMTSAQLRDRLQTNEIRETAEVSDWLFWLRARTLSGG